MTKISSALGTNHCWRTDDRSKPTQSGRSIYLNQELKGATRWAHRLISRGVCPYAFEL